MLISLGVSITFITAISNVITAKRNQIQSRKRNLEQQRRDGSDIDKLDEQIKKADDEISKLNASLPNSDIQEEIKSVRQLSSKNRKDSNKEAINDVEKMNASNERVLEKALSDNDIEVTKIS